MYCSSCQKINLIKCPQKPSRTLFQNRPFRSNCFELLEVFANLSFVFLLTPYKPVLIQGVLVLKITPIRKVLCRILQTLCLVRSTLKMWIVLGKPIKLLDDPTRLFLIANETADAVGVFTFVTICWVKGQQGFPRLYKTCFDNLETKVYNQKPKGKSFWFWMCIGFLAFLNVLFEYIQAVTLDVLEPSKKWSRIEKLFYKTGSSMTQGPDGLFAGFIPQEGTGYWVISSGFYFIRIYSLLINRAGLFFLPVSACIITYRVSLDLIRSLKENNPNLAEVIGYYNSVKTVLLKINEILGGLMAVCIVSSLSYFSFLLPVMLDNVSTSIFTRMELGFFFGIFAVAVVLASEANLKFQSIGEYIFENRLKAGFAEDPDLDRVLMEFRHNNIGLKAYAFTITFHFIASIYSTVVTYFIILLQFKISKPING